MTKRQSRQPENELGLSELVDKVLGCDDRTRRAKALMLTLSGCVVIVLMSVMAALELASTSATTAGLGGGLIAVAAIVWRKMRGARLPQSHRR